MTEKNIPLGIACAVAVIFIWSGFIVFSRMGVTSELTPYDLSALRFIVAGVITLPFLWRWWPRHLPWYVIVLLLFCGPGAIYSLLLYLGLQDAPAAYAGVFANGSIPIFTMMLAAFLSGDRPGPRRIVAVVIIIAGAVLVGWRGMQAGGTDILSGLALFLSASAMLSVYIWGIGRWSIKPLQALAMINIPNVAIYLPLWYFFLPSGLSEASTDMILFQAAFQGLGPGFLAVLIFTTATIHLGPTPTAAFSASVPAGAALLAIPMLDEVPTQLEWAGVGLVTLGLAVLVWRARK
jgi:drug/metabolite transporter (DMT)-like permease